MPEVSVTSKGQVTIPKRIRDELGIAAGSKVAFELAGGSARLRLVGKPASARIEDGPAILGYSGPRIAVRDLQGIAAAKKAKRHARG